MLEKYTKVLKISLMAIISIFIFTNISMNNMNVQASELNSKEVESILKTIVDTYGSENMIFEDGITIGLGEEVKISDFSDSNFVWTSYNNDILEIL